MMRWLADLMQSNVVAEAPTRSPPRPSTQSPPRSARAEPGETLAIQLALVIDLNVCVGCHACVTSCKEWNTSGSAGPLAD
ncbi:MAG: ferredoxin, partial [Burkholderiaceae bacterium]